MDLARLATVNDRLKLQYIRNIFSDLLTSIQNLPFETKSKRDAIPIIRAAANANIYDGEYDGVIRKYYAFRGDFTKVWFTLDFLNVQADQHPPETEQGEMHVIMTYLTQQLLREVRP